MKTIYSPIKKGEKPDGMYTTYEGAEASEVKIVTLPDEEEIREPIQDALYATGNFKTDQCTELAAGIVEYLNEWGFTIIKTN